jgi:hypothetical protein
MDTTTAVARIEAEIDRAKSKIESEDRHNPGPKNSNSYYWGGYIAALNFLLPLVRQINGAE